MSGQEIGIEGKTGTETVAGTETLRTCSVHVVYVHLHLIYRSTEDPTVIMLRNMREAVVKEDVRTAHVFH